jgi:hypothetical protein
MQCNDKYLERLPDQWRRGESNRTGGDGGGGEGRWAAGFPPIRIPPTTPVSRGCVPEGRAAAPLLAMSDYRTALCA